VVVLISLLLVTSIVLTHYNNTIIQRNKRLQQEAEWIKLYTEQIGKSTIHGIDIGLRGYAIMGNAQFFTPVDSAILRKDSILHNIESRLQKQNYDLREFHTLRDSLNSYVAFALHLRDLLASNKRDEFIKEFSSDRGLSLWLQYLQCLKNIAAFENEINVQAELEYQAALRRNYMLQIFLFVICCPTLIYTAIHTRKRFRLSRQINDLEAEKNKLLTEQNHRLEYLVNERTKEIASQNEKMVAQSDEIAAQRDLLSLQNKRLSEIQAIIEEQKRSIENENERLEHEVSNRTQQLQLANQQLIQHNIQLEQFGFIAAHNLRAPLARILGLANVIEITTDEADRTNALKKLLSSTRDMDGVIRDLNTILDLKKQNANYSEVDLEAILKKVMKTLEKERSETNTTITYDFGEEKTIFAITPYVESILYNLVSNAIKYRHPDRTPKIILKTTVQDGFVRLSVKDNGLGIDLTQHQQNVFSLYKRFHLHMEGKGLGLYLVKTQVVALGGRIELESKPNLGSTFLLYFKVLAPPFA
jgi:signal transduction histidine kinase